MAPQDDWWKADKAVTPGQPIITKRANPNADLERQKLAAETTKTQAEATEAQHKVASLDAQDPKSAKIEKELQSDNVISSINQARTLIHGGHATGNFFGTKGFQSIPVMGQNSSDLAASLSGIQGSVINDTIGQLKAMSPNGASGYGSLTETEADRLAASVAALQQTQSEASLMANLDRVEEHYRNAKALLNGEDPRDETVKRKYGLSTSLTPPGGAPPATGAPPSAPPPPPAPHPSGGGAPPNGVGAHYNPAFDSSLSSPESAEGAGFDHTGVKQVDDPALAGVRAQYLKMLGENRPAGEILGYLDSVGVKNPGALASAAAQIKFRQENPRVPLASYSTQQLDDRFVPTTTARQVLNAGGDTDVGAGVISAADALTAFNMARLTDDPNLTRAGIAEVQARHKKSALIGTVAGGALAGMTAEAGLARAGLTGGAGVFAPRLVAADAIYGGAANYGLHGDNATLGDAAKGAALGMAGGVGARTFLKGTAGALAPNGGRYSSVMADGVRPTIGQRFAGDGWVGNAANNTEQALQSIPVLGQMVKGARQGARDQWETAGYNRALREIPAVDDAGAVSATQKEALPAGTGPGGDAIAYTRKAFDGIYDKARSGMKFVPDQQYGQDFGQFQQKIMNSGVLDDTATAQLDKIIRTTVGSRLRNGELAGDAYKTAVSDLRKAIDRTGGKPELQAALKDYRSILDDAARRNSDPAAVALMDAADKGYAQFKPLKDAAAMAGSDPGRFTVTGLDSVERRTMGKTNAFLEGNTYLSDYLDAGRGLRDTLPNSGTADRGAALAVLGGAGYVNPVLPVAALGATIPYAPGVRNVVSAAMAPRNVPALNTLADVIRSRQGQLGAVGAPLAIDYLGGPP
jgi:hypothetical protein